MAKKSTRNTRGKIIDAAWKLFYRQGYDDTTVEEIIEESGTSRGSFYHYFQGKDALLSTLADVFDRKYEELVRFTVSASEDVVTLVILEDLPSLLHVDLGDFLAFTIDVPAELPWWWLTANYYVREAFAVVKTALFDR